jgi:hypothetical protein
MNLTTPVSAAEFDEHYQMAFVYCYDAERRYCFSLSRFPDESEIEVMVGDQSVYKVHDLSVELNGSALLARMDHADRPRDFHERYSIDLRIEPGGEEGLHRALRKIFEGKKGLSIRQTGAAG